MKKYLLFLLTVSARQYLEIKIILLFMGDSKNLMILI